MKKKWIAIVGIIIIIGIGMFVMLFVLEDFSGPMVLVNSRTPFFVGGALLCLAATIAFFRKKDDE